MTILSVQQLRQDLREGDDIDIRLRVHLHPSKGLTVRLGDSEVPLNDLVPVGHGARIRRKDYVREKGCTDLGGPRIGKVITFYDAGGNEHPEGGSFVLVMPCYGAMMRHLGPKSYDIRAIERMPLKDWPKQ